MARQQSTVTESDGKIRADKFLANKHPDYSRSALAKLFDLNMVTHDGSPIAVGHRLQIGDTIEYNLAPLADKPEVIQLPIVYEDENVVVVDKPVGIIAHARGRFWQEASVASFIRDRISGMDGERGGIVHRLDRATSGLMICAKNEATLKYLQKQFSDRTVKKTYVAVTTGIPSIDEAIIDAPIGRNLNDPKSFMIDVAGKVAQTHYKILQKSDKNRALLELTPATGRTHQLRVHLQYIHTPILGDPLYGTQPHERMMLHARSLQIKLPSGDETTFESVLPESFQDAMTP